ncbi:MAG TPA: GNAT family N-acetyltransferase [Ktedonobacterales bacterium]
MNIQDVANRIVAQRMNRFPDVGPLLRPAGEARYRQEGIRLRVAFASIRPGMAAEAVQRVLRYARARGMAVHWVVMPHRVDEQELPPALQAAGFYLAESLLLMAHEGAITAPISPTVVISPIVTWQAMLDYERGSRQAFFDEASPSELAIVQRARDRWREQEHGWCRYYVALLRGVIVGGCYVSLFEEIPTIMGVYTVPSARGQGIATALLERAIGETIRPDRDVCCLFVRHGNPAERLDRQLGFAGLLDEDTYTNEIT